MVVGRLAIMLLLLQITVSTWIFYVSLGGEYCSNSSMDIHCIACVECHGRYDTCYACPINCKTKCSFVCSARCQNDKCESTNDGKLKCTDGCIPGATGLFCREICPRSCKDLLCYQHNSKCHSCKDGLSGDYCNETVSITTAITTGPNTSVLFTDSTVVIETSVSNICLPSCKYCADSETDTKCCSEDGTSCENETVSHKTEDAKSVNEDSINIPLITVLASFLCVSTGISLFLYRKVYHMQSICTKRITTSELYQSSNRISDHGYSYIDVNDLYSYYSQPSQRARTNRYSASNSYRIIEHDRILSGEESGSVSVESTISETMFGNLFETEETRYFNSTKTDIANDNIRQLSAADNDRYLSPTLTYETIASSFA